MAKGIYRVRDGKSGGKLKSRQAVQNCLKHNLRASKHLEHISENGSIEVLRGGESVNEVMKRFDSIINTLDIKPD